MAKKYEDEMTNTDIDKVAPPETTDSTADERTGHLKNTYNYETMSVEAFISRAKQQGHNKQHYAKHLTLKEGLKHHPQNARLHFELGKSLIKSYKPPAEINDEKRPEQNFDAEAEKMLIKAYKLDANCFRALTKLGQLYTRQERFIEAKQCFTLSILGQPEHNFTLVHLGNMYEKKNEFQKARGCFGRARGINPQNSIASTRLQEIEELSKQTYCYYDWTQVCNELGLTENDQEWQPKL